jgi:hypothetical protein
MRRSAGVLLILCATLAGSAPASAGTRDQPPEPTPQQQAAIAACKAKGLQPNTDAFQKCLQAQLGSAAPAPLTPQQQAAVDACKAKGLSASSDAFKQCVQSQLSAGGPPGGGSGGSGGSNGGSKPLTPQQQAAIDACKAKGFAVNSDDFMQCIKEQTSTGPALNDKQQAAVDACTAKGLKKLTDAFKLCVQQQGSLDGLTAKQQGAVATCQGKGLKIGSADFNKCVGDLLTTAIPGSADTGAAAAQLEAAAKACKAKGLDHPAGVLLDCVKKQLGK